MSRADDRFENALTIIRSAVEGGQVPSAAMIVRKRGQTILDWVGGALPDQAPVFLIASITKPIVCAAAALLLERGLFDLDDPLAMHMPEFAANGKGGVLIRHLFTHTSGLPDMLPENEELRRRQAPLSEFVAGVCAQPLLFEPGSRVSYQSMGILMLAELVERKSGLPLRDLLERQFFGPLGMRSTSLGLAPRLAGRVVDATAAADAEGSWVWNTPYWRNLGAPWGGAFSTTGDLARFLEAMLGGGELDGTRVLGAGTVSRMLSNQIAVMPGIPERIRASEAWGLGWRIQLGGLSGFFGALVPPGAFGHAGATGTLAWADPAGESACVILTNGPMPQTGRTLMLVSNAVAAQL